MVKKRALIVTSVILVILTLSMSLMACVDDNEDKYDYEKACKENFKVLSDSLVGAKDKNEKDYVQWTEGDLTYTFILYGNMDIAIRAEEKEMVDISGVEYENSLQNEIRFRYGSGNEDGFPLVIAINKRVYDYNIESNKVEPVDTIIIDDEAAFFLDTWQASSYPEKMEYKNQLEKIANSLMNKAYDYVRTKYQIKLFEKPGLDDILGDIL